ncbi:MAG: mercuric reductase [Vicinamibacterales bacterium]
MPSSVDDADDRLVDLVHPPAWRNPEPRNPYNLVVIGGGTAGLVAAMGAAGLGAHVALVERHRLGGDCLNVGCVPSKALLRSARVVGEAGRAASLGVHVGTPRVDAQAVLGRLRARRAALAANDSAARFTRAGVDVFFGDARFEDRRTIVVGGAGLRFARAVIATGTRPAVPPIPGLDTVPFLTNETVFDVAEVPARLLVLGAGPIGCELAQAWARLGAAVTLIDVAPGILPREDADAAAWVRRSLERDCVRLALGRTVTRAERAGESVRLHLGASGPDPAAVHEGDQLLVATGRAPNVEGLNLPAAGVRASAQGIEVDDRLRTANARIYASGDVASPYRFTHAADALSRIVVQNALFFGRRRASALVVPWVTFTDPELAHVGVHQADVARADGRLATIEIPLAEVDRAVLDEATDGFVRIHHEGGRIRGATIVGAHAGELIGEVAYAMTTGGTLSQLSSVVHPYPTLGEALRKAGDAYRRTALTPTRRRWLSHYFRLRR